MTPFCLIAGLGNPGIAYRRTRHNLGFIVVDQFAREKEVPWKKERRFLAQTAQVPCENHTLMLAKPLTYMNESGQSIALLCRYFKASPSQVIIVHDDITLEFARVRISTQGSAGGHNGVQSVLQAIGEGFVQFRLGIGGKKHAQMDLSDHVLSLLTPEEELTLTNLLPEFIDKLKLLVDKGTTIAMNVVNQRKKEINDRHTK